MRTKTRLLLIDFLANCVPGRHPQVLPYLERGWTIHSVGYRVLGALGPKLLVRLVAPG